jgi:uncharacterized membrane protein YkoI
MSAIVATTKEYAMKKWKFVVIAALGAAFPLLGAHAVLADPTQQQAPRVSLSDARVTALHAVPGTIVEEGLETEHGKSVYSFTIRADAAPKDAALKEVKVSADTGAVVSVEDDDGDGDHESG